MESMKFNKAVKLWVFSQKTDFRYFDNLDKMIKIIKKIDDSHVWGAPIVTLLEQFSAFYPAEESHQKYLIKNPTGYTCHFKRNITFD